MENICGLLVSRVCRIIYSSSVCSKSTACKELAVPSELYAARKDSVKGSKKLTSTVDCVIATTYGLATEKHYTVVSYVSTIITVIASGKILIWRIDQFGCLG